MPNWPEDPGRRNVYGDVYGQSLPMPGQSQLQGIPSLADLATLVSYQPPQQSGLPSPTFQQQQPSLGQLQPPLMPQSQQAASATDQPPKKPFFSLPDVANALYEGATQQFIPGLKGAAAQLYAGGERPDLQPEWVQRYQAEARAAQDQSQKRVQEQQAAGLSSSAGESIREAIPSLGFSLGSMAAALPAGIAGTVATGPIGGAVAAGAAAGAAGYRMAESQFLGDAFAKLEEESRKTRGRGLDEQEKVAAYRELKPIAEHTGLWEAGPEAIGNAAMFGLGRVALGFMPKEAMQNLAKTALGRVGIRAGAAAGAAGTEVATETATQVAQGNDQAKADAAIKAFVEGKPMGPAIAGAERPYDGLAGLQKAYNDVVGATLATVVMMGGLAKGAHLAYKPIANRIEAGQRGQEADTAVNQADPIRTNLEFAREADIAEALARFDEIENAGRLPKSAARRIDSARQQLLGELSLRVSPESISAPMNSQRGMAGYLGFSERVNELDDAQLADLAGRALPENAEPTLTEAAKRYQSEIGRRQALTDAAAHFEQNPDAVIGVAKTLDDIASGKPMSKGAHGSTAFNLASLSDDMLRRYQLAGEVLSSQYADKVGNLSDKIDKARELLNEESQRRAEGQTRDPEAIREADLAERAAAAIAKGKKPNIKGLSFETLDRMASGLEARAALEPRLADSARMLREAAQQGRMRAFNPQGQQQPGIQSAMRGWNAGQTEDPAQPIDFTQDRARLSELAQQADVTSRQRAILDQEAQRRAIREQQRVARSQEIAALNQQNPPLATPQGLPTVTPSAIPQSLGQLGQTRLGNGVDQLPIPAQPQPSTPNVTESQGQGRPGQAPPMGLPARPTGASQSQARGTPEQAASALLQQVPGRLGEQARLNQERVRRQGEWQAFGPDTGTLGIPRADMPQVKAEHRGALVNFLNARGVAHEQDEEVDPATLKPTQAEFSPKKVQQANEYQGGNRSILVSSDWHVVDGHHQWLSALSKGEPIKAIRLDAPIADLLPLVKEFPSSTESKASTASGGQTGQDRRTVITPDQQDRFGDRPFTPGPELARDIRIEREINQIESAGNKSGAARKRGFYDGMLNLPSRRSQYSKRLQVSYDQGVKHAKSEREIINDRFGGIWYSDSIEKDGNAWVWRAYREGIEFASGKSASRKRAETTAFEAKLDNRYQPQPEQRREERQAEAAPLLNREVAPPSNAAPTYTGKAPWEMALDEFAQSRIDASGYADAYREDPKAADDFKKGQQSKWIDALRARAEEGRISDVALDDFVGRYGMPALHREFRGVLEKGIEGYQPPEIRNSPIRKTPETAQNQPWEMTWEEYRKKATPDGVPDNAAKTPAYWKSLKNQHRNIIARALSRKESVPDRVFSDYPDLKPAKETSAAADQLTNKKPADLILWGYKPGTSDVPIKLGPFSKAAQARREKDGWKTAAYAKGDEPTGLREQAKKEAAKAPAPPTPNRQRQQVVTASGRKIDTEFEVVELDDLITSDKAEFPKALQPRDRSRLSSANQVMTIAGKLDPQQLADSRLASDGAPVIGPDNVVESGNGRAMALREVYGRERLQDRADAYRAMIEAKGFDVAGMKQPVLVRRRITTLTDQERKAFTEEANARNTLGMSPAERAMVHAGRMDATLLGLYKGGDLTTLANSDFVRGFMSEVAPDESAEIRTADGLLNQEGIRRIEAAILAKAYPDSALLGTLLESTDNNIKAIGGALLDSAPAMAGMKGKIAQGLILPETDISAEVVESARLVAKARREGKLLSELLAQSGMFGDNVSPLAQRIVRLFFADTDFKRQISRDKIAGLLNTYAELAKNIKPGDALFDDLPALTVGDVIGALEKKNREPEKQQQPALFGGNPARQSGTTGGRETQRPDDGAPGATAGAAEQGPSQADDLGAIFDQELEKAFANAPSTGESVERDREIDQTENGVGTEDVPTQRAGTGRRTRNASGTDEGGRAPEQGDSGVSNAPSAVPGAKRAGGISAKDGTVRPQRGATGSGDSGRGGQPSSERIRSSRGAASRSGRTSKAADAGVKAGQAAVEVGQGLKATMDGLAALFGGKGKLSSGLTFDEETYQQAVPFFKDAVRHFKDAAKDAREAIRLLIQAMMGGGYDKAVIASMKPYAIRFVTDVQNGVIDLTETEPHAEPETIEPARVDYTAKRDAQRAAESVAVKVGDIDNIRATLPYLLPEQQNDVLKAEQRFERNNGILFTNATGTGKTYTGLGVIKRMVKAGKENILIVVPSQTKAQDWVDDGKNLGLDITVLPDTQTAGKGQVITTYANLSENDALDRREWDAIVYDESHKLASNQAGKNTVYQDRHERLTMYSGAALQNRANSLLSEADRATRNRLLNKINAARGRSREEALTKDELGEWDRINEKIAKIAQDLSTKTKPKVVFLSATPFAYHQNLDYADKLLFDYEQDYTPTFGYNAPSARQAFFIRHFGYRMRTGKLTEPDVNVDVDLMERRFHEWLKKTGAVSGRKLTTDQDYSREFVEIENSVGKAIDRGIDIINGYHEDGRDGNQSKFPALSARLQANLDFLAKSRLLEAIKAESAAKRARQHIALGRKVVIFHDYIEGNNQHPFRFPNISEDHVSQQILKREIDRFNREFPELVNLDLGKLSTVIGAFQREFGDQAKFFNGRETKKNRARAIAEFNRDDNATQILVVQRDAGKEGISLHDVTGKRPRALIDLGLPTAPTEAIQTEGRIYRYGQKSNAVIEYLKSNTKFEEHMFARRVASRARTAENLALGDMARNMENAFVDAYLNSSNDAPSDKQGTGNTAADARIQNDVPFDTARSLYFGQRKRTSRDKSREGVDYFATPEPLGLKMVEWADASTGDAMLEPSAGHGAIARWFPEDTRNTFVEPSRELSVQLGLSARHGKILDHDFETLHVTNKYDAIVMNPPFGSGGATAIAHLGKAAGHLKNGGRIVVLYPEGPAADKRMSAFLEKTDNLYTVAEFGLPPVVFERAGTTAKTRVLVLEKQLNADDAPNGQGRIDLNADTIGEFFDKIRDLSVKPRNKPTKAAELEPATAPITPAARGTVNDLLARSDESWLTARGDGVRRVLSKDGIKAAIDHLVPELAQEDSAVAVAFVRMGRSSTGLIPSRETNRLLSLGMAVLNHLRKMNLTGKGFEAFDRYASISGALRDALDAKYRDSTAAPVTAPSDQDAVGFILNRTTHAKKSLEAGQPVPWFSVSMDRKISSAAYTALAAQAKKLGGYWSSYRGHGAIPGFQFSSEQAATDFIAAASTGNSYSMPSGRGGATPAQTRADLSRALGADVVARLEQSGRLVIHDKPPTGAAAGAQGWVDQKGVIHLVPANLESSALSVALHEAMHLARDDRFSEGNRAHIRLAHAALKITGLKNFIGNPGFSNLVQQLHRLAAEGNKTAIEALDKARREAPGNVEDEALAYLVQYADEKLPLVRRIIAAIRAALYRMGIKVKLTPADVRALALSALKARAKDAALVQTARAQEAFSQPTTEAEVAEQDRLWQEFQAVRAQFQAKQASQSAFDRWFGKGVEGVNARNEKPLVLYHGTNNPEFNRWDESRSWQASQHPTAGLGFFMTSDKRSAARYGSRLLELHAKIDNPYYMTDADLVSIEDTQDAARFRRKLQAQGYDAAVISAPGGAPYVVALRSNQVKLASNDNPTENEDFRYSRPGGRQSSPSENPLPAETMGQAALRTVQDRFIRFRVIQDWLKQHGVNLTPDADVYGAESLLPKVTAARTQDAREKILKPLIESAAGKKWSIQGGDLLAAIEDQHPFPTKFKPSIPEFLHAQHAIERNAQIAKIKGAPKDGSGLSDAQAHEILTRYRVMPNFSEFSAMAEKFRAITDQTRRILRTSGIISSEQESAWTSAYKKYVPLKGGPDKASQQMGTGPGISANPGLKRALGHRLRDENIVENIWRDHERAIYLSEKQKVTRALRNMLDQANNQDIGTVGRPEKKATIHQGYYHQVWIDGNPLGAYGSYNEAKAAISADAQQSGRPLSKYAVVHKPADPAVVFMSRPMLADNEVALYENGQRIRLQLNDELLARAARNLGVDGASGLLKAAQSFNRWLSHAYTGYNPEFILANVARDMTTGMINLSGQYGGKFALKTLKGYGSAVRGLWKQIHGKADPWVDRYRAAGGSTGAAYLSDLERIGTDLKRIFQDYQGASETLQQGDRAGAVRVAVSDKIRWLGGWIEKMNQVGENALRVATFRAMVEAGHSDAVAARAAGDVTVNFNRKGELTPTLGGLYLFFNPSIQGTKAMWDAMAKGAHRGQAMALAGSLTLLALTLAELARGGDDADEEAWKRIPGYVKDRNMVIKMGDIQGTIPIPYGYGAFWSLGNILSDLSHGEDKTKAGIRFASSLFEQFSAIGNPFAGDEADIKNAVSLLPTALKPMMEIAMNRNSLGRPIMPEMSPWNTAQPDSARRWRSTTGSLYDGIASGLNSWTGGNDYQAGAIDISPETLSYLWRTFTGGAGKFAIDSMGLGARIAQGVSPELREIPVLRKFVRAESIQDARTLFNEQSATVRLAVDAFNAAKRAKDLPAMRQMIDEQRQVLALGKVLQTAQKMIRARREFEDRINQSDLPLEEKRAQLKAVEKQESAILSRFTARFEKARQGGD